jgi:uncharacterized membrane protein YczE
VLSFIYVILVGMVYIKATQVLILIAQSYSEAWVFFCLGVFLLGGGQGRYSQKRKMLCLPILSLKLILCRSFTYTGAAFLLNITLSITKLTSCMYFKL